MSSLLGIADRKGHVIKAQQLECWFHCRLSLLKGGSVGGTNERAGGLGRIVGCFWGESKYERLRR
jgi:hypothetical protein